MVLIKYVGSMRKCKVSFAGIWYKDEVKEVDDFTAKKLLTNSFFVLVSKEDSVKSKKVVKKDEVKEEKSDALYDLDGDGDFDKDDVSIAGCVLAKSKSLKD